MFGKRFGKNCLCVLILGMASIPFNSNTAFAANTGLSEAQKQMGQRNYAEAVRIFYQVAIQSDGDTKARAEFGLVDGLQQLGLIHSATYFYMRIAIAGGKNPFFRMAMDRLADLNSLSSIGRASISSLFDGRVNIDPILVPPGARGFYFFYKGLEFYERERAAEAKAEFSRVPRDSPYFAKAQYYIGILSTLSRDFDTAINAFKAAASVSGKENFKHLAILALARIYYEQKQMRRAFEYYSQIPRDSDLWLQTLFEGSWAFFLIQKPNNTLGSIHTIHSPFFSHRFFPETYILQAITYLKLCYFSKVDSVLKGFQQRYKPTFQDLHNLLKKYREQNAAFYNLNLQYRNSGDLREFPAAAEIIDSTSRSDAFKEGFQVVKAIDREEKQIARSYASRWENSGLMDVLRKTFEDKKLTTIDNAGKELFMQAVADWRYLKDLSEQTQLIHFERTTAQTDQLRARFNSQDFQVDNSMWGEGMKPLNLANQLEYWPFEGEYWEDELGGYVYNVESKCAGDSARKGSAKRE